MTSFFGANVHTPFPLISSSIKIHRTKSLLAMKVEIQSRKWIKPSVSTPPTLSPHKISFIDEFSPQMNLPIVLFSPPRTDCNPISIITRLEESLKKTLTLLYPLAGRYMEDTHTIDCNDQGVEFIQAQTDITIQEITNPKVDHMLISEFTPSKLLAREMLSTQLTMFKCGGLALAATISHRIGDVSTIITFLNHWATLSRKDSDDDDSMVKGFIPSTSFPARGLPYTELGFSKLINKNDYVTKKLSFSESAISDMKTKVAMNGRVKKHQLFKVQLVSGLIWKAFIGVDHAVYHYPRDFVLVQPIALRQKGEKITSLTPKHSLGNRFGLIVTESGTSTTKFEELTSLLVDSVMKTAKEYSKVSYDDGYEREEMVLNSLSRFTSINPDTTNVTWLVSWSKFPFYDVDFGFGKPIWVSCGYMLFKRGMVLLDDVAGNGVEAYVTMEIKDAPYFEQDEDIKTFSS